MSAETLKYFEEKSTEEIINWMLSNLSEEQIRMCLNESGIPDTTVIKRKQPVATSEVDSGPTSVVTPSDDTPKQLQKGEGSSSEPLKPETKKSNKQNKLNKMLLDNYRKKCKDTGYVIKSVSKESGVEYYKFKEIEDDDIIVSQGREVNDVGWVKKTAPYTEFRGCREVDNEDFLLLLEDNMETFLDAPPEIIEVSMDYQTMGLVPPIPIKTKSFEITQPMIKALKIQQGSSKIIKDMYPEMYDSGLTMFPVFVYGSEDQKVLHLSTVVSDGKLSFVKNSTSVGVLNYKFKQVLKLLNENIEKGLYKPSTNIQEELQVALQSMPNEISTIISKIYDRDKINSFMYFGTLDDEISDYQESFDVVSPEFPPVIEQSRRKKISEMTIPEIEEYMKIKFGVKFANEFKPEKYKNSQGVMSVKYVKRQDCKCSENSHGILEPIFTGFGRKPSLNSDSDTESDDELLFD